MLNNMNNKLLTILKILDGILSVSIYFLYFFILIAIDILKNIDDIIHLAYDECVKIKENRWGLFIKTYSKNKK